MYRICGDANPAYLMSKAVHWCDVVIRISPPSLQLMILSFQKISPQLPPNPHMYCKLSSPPICCCVVVVSDVSVSDALCDTFIFYLSRFSLYVFIFFFFFFFFFHFCRP